MSKRKFIKYDEIHPLLPTPESQLIALNPSTKKSWLRALRSGDYKQGQAALRKVIRRKFLGREIASDECYCCLGVYADVTDPKAWKPPRFEGKCYNWHDADGAFPVQHAGKQSTVFTQQTKNYDTSHKKTDSVAWTLMKANDGILQTADHPAIAPATFEQIALWIERYL